MLLLVSDMKLMMLNCDILTNHCSMYRFIDNNESTVKRYYIKYLLIARFSFVSITLTTLEIDGTE